jgi:predicted MFS family arabinose efflux permease
MKRRRHRQWSGRKMPGLSGKIWLVICSAAALVTITMGLRAGFGLFLAPISIDFGMGREVFAFAVALQNLVWGAASPFFGGLADKHGVVRVSLIGTALYVAGLLLMAVTSGPFEVIAGNVLVGMALGAAGLSTVLGAVARMVPAERRSLALGLVTAGGSVGQFALVPFTHVLIDGLGWSGAFIGLAFTAGLMFPLIWGVREAPKAAVSADGQTLLQALDEAFRHRGFWLLTVGFFVCGFHVVFVATHLPAYLGDKGMAPWLGAWTLGLVGLFNIIGSYSAGVLGGRHLKKNLLTLIYLTRAALFLLFILLPLSNFTVLAFGALLGLLWLSTVPLTSGLIGTVFGPAYMSMLYGVVFFSHQIGSFFGAWLGGKLYDMFGSYDAMWWISVALGLGAAALHWPIAERPVMRLAPAGAAQ